MSTKNSLKKFYNAKRLKEEANKIIKQLEAYMKLISPEKAKEILKFGQDCNPILVKGKYISPSSDIRAYHEIFSNILHSKFISYACQATNSLEIEYKIMNKIYAHFYKLPKNYKSGAYWGAGFYHDMFKAKAGIKKMKKTW